MSDPVKGSTEAGRRREQRAWDTRARIAHAALRLFLERGYRATSIEAVANEAGVAPATVYQAFGTKHALLARALDVTVAGDTAVPLLDRDWVARARARRSARRRLADVVQHAAEIAARTAPLKAVIRDAVAVDPRARDLLDEDHRRRRQTQRALVEIVVGGEGLRPGMTVAGAADTFSMLVNSDSYLHATAVLGWSDAGWQAWLVEVLSQQLLGGES